MRMWMCDPKIMCRNHLIGEYREIFTFAGTLRLKKKIDGYIRNNCLEPLSLVLRFNELKDEMIRRGYKCKAILNFKENFVNYLPKSQKEYQIDVEQSLKNLLERCPECNKRFKELKSL